MKHPYAINTLAPFSKRSVFFIDEEENPFGYPGPRGHKIQEYVVFPPKNTHTTGLWRPTLGGPGPFYFWSYPNNAVPYQAPKIIFPSLFQLIRQNMPLSRPQQSICHQSAPSSSCPRSSQWFLTPTCSSLGIGPLLIPHRSTQ